VIANLWLSIQPAVEELIDHIADAANLNFTAADTLFIIFSKGNIFYFWA